jgi:hypothetical protein
MKRLLVIICVFICSFVTHASAYSEKYPPYAFGSVPEALIDARVLIDVEHTAYRSSDGTVVVEVKEQAEEFVFSFNVDGVTLIEKNVSEGISPSFIYETDLDANGRNDYIVISDSRGCGLAAQISMIDLFMSEEDGSFSVISYETFDAAIQDFLQDGTLLRMDMYGGAKHNYFVYSRYRVDDGVLVNVNSEHKGFPKFIWYTNEANDKDTTHLSPEERAAFIKGMESKVTYRAAQK